MSSSEDIGVRPYFSSQMDILNAVGRIARDVLGPRAAEIDRDATWPAMGVKSLQEGGLGGLTIPRKYGGLGQGLYGLTRACEILGSECASTAICFGMHCVGASVIAAQATQQQVDAYLHPIAEGKHLTTLALSETGTGSHFYLPQTRLLRDGELYRVNGTKQFVTNGGYADSYVVSAMGSDGDGLARLSCVVVKDGLTGIAWGPAWAGFGMRGNSSRSMTLDGVAIDSADLLGAEGDQIWYVLNVVAPYFLMAMSGTYLGVASAALSLARQHIVERGYAHDGSKLAEVSLIQHRFSTLWSKLESTRQFVYSAARGFDSNDSGAVVQVLSSKAETADTAVAVVNEVMTLMGGIAYRDGAQLQRHLRDVRAAQVMAPTTDILRTWAGRLLLGQPLFGE